MTRSAAVVGCPLLLLALACGSDPDEATTAASAGSGGAAATGWSDYCDARAKLGCAGFDASACKQEESCARATIRDEGEAMLFACLADHCDWDLEKGCMVLLAEVATSAAGDAFAEACKARVSECMVSDDACSSHFVLSDAELSELGACFDAPTCGETETCIDAYWTALFDTCWSWL